MILLSADTWNVLPDMDKSTPYFYGHGMQTSITLTIKLNQFDQYFWVKKDRLIILFPTFDWILSLILIQYEIEKEEKVHNFVCHLVLCASHFFIVKR